MLNREFVERGGKLHFETAMRRLTRQGAPKFRVTAHIPNPGALSWTHQDSLGIITVLPVGAG